MYKHRPSVGQYVDGSTHVETDGAGTLHQYLNYEPYGKVRYNFQAGAWNNDYKFTGKEQDSETNWQYFGARYYDNNRGQFMSADPVFVSIGDDLLVSQLTGDNGAVQRLLMDPQQLNSYSYAKNNPFAYKDAEGKYVETAFDVAMLTLSLNDFRQRPNFWNGLGVIADGASLALPIPAIVGGIRHADDAAKFLRGADKVDNVTELGRISSKYNWGSSNTLIKHTMDHAKDFGLAKNDYAGYARKANNWINNAKGNSAIDSVIDAKGYTKYYDAKNNIFGVVNGQGKVASFYKPNPRVHGFKSNADYWRWEKGGRK